ncbi:MAG: fumarylacetoacetate hydrolase family protein [Actinomycetota bacterium]|nr:fumarylacetoacetate hydrolase family protein [Actinomycetota bacterium]
MTFRFANINHRSSLVLERSFFDLETISGGRVSSDPMEALNQSDLLHDLSSQLEAFDSSGSIDNSTLCAPIPRPSNSYGVGLNYQLHIDEASLETPDVPMIFTKFPSCISDPNADLVMRSDQCDYEGELLIVIGPGGKDIHVTEAWDHVLGLAVGQDFSDRSVQFKDSPPQFNLGKSFDTFGPIGPILVSVDSFVDPTDLEITTKVNGEVRQHDRTSNMIFDVPKLISYLSSITSLSTGDIIFSGTPEGVGFRNGYFLQDGDVVETSIDGIGTLRNRCVRGTDFA